jgi:UDP-N-acetylglucosamine--N-acetylmuramyl-(pentapeptide) pyrophosphoryl-undecaprenol N-acetylglucosamine transferase
MRIMITGGGTGGHTSPALAVYDELARRDPQLRAQWVGCAGKIEARICKQRGIPFRPVPVAGWPRRGKIRKIWVAALLGAGLLRSAMLLRAFRPQVVFGVGGYVSLPLMLAAQRLGIPTVIHEQNRRLGMANQMLAPRAARIYLSFPDTRGNYPPERAQVVGNPVRPEFVAPPGREEAIDRFSLSPDRPVVLVFGGSQGARTINQAIEDKLDAWLSNGVQLIWATGTGDYEAVRARVGTDRPSVRLYPYLDDMVAACVAADLVIARAGASTTAELAVLGKPCILVPYPFATDDHQTQNAAAFEEAGAGVVLRDILCTGDVLLEEARGILGDPERLSEMTAQARSLARPLAADAIAEGLVELIFGTGAGPASPEEPVQPRGIEDPND